MSPTFLASMGLFENQLYQPVTMKIYVGLLSIMLLAIAAEAAPLTEERQAQHESRRLARLKNRESHPPYKIGTNEILRLNKTSKIEYSSNWAGAVLIGADYTAVTADFIVPIPQVPNYGDGNKQYCASAWVGIDGDTCGTAILQTGIDFCVQGRSTSYSACDINISAGDLVRMTVDATSKTSGAATVDNISTGRSVTHTFNSGIQGDLCEYNAEWIVEDFEINNSLVPLANFGTVTFLNSLAIERKSVVGPSDATLIDIRQNNRILTSSSVDRNSVTVKYVM
ncbi:hypothetical protein N7533_013306 [Penicillium manginii]|uniref:uncharacterized protein n=1 Tax=Penicillium manginii TaxID=203109 RepID=UPI0025474C0F|nr:uncharacterized protein N7533_013306 [Penicillium manginii]KAJ5732859.1 hypothetical protein N7533_013306 [Penicillium manginii]